MFEFVTVLSNPIQGRLDTMVRNIKSQSNSFYDSFIELLEEIGKDIAERNNINLEGKTSGYIFRNPLVRQFIITMLRPEGNVMDKVDDYILKVNGHKHRKEKTVSLDAVINYSRVAYGLLTAYAAWLGSPAQSAFDEEEIKFLFGSSERENKSLRAEVKKLMEEIGANKELSEQAKAKLEEDLELAKADKLSLEDENDGLRQQIILLKDLKLEVLEGKLDKANAMLLNLSEYLVESRAVSLAALSSIVGKENMQSYIDRVKEDMNNGGEKR